MADAAIGNPAAVARKETSPLRHSAMVRVTHWIVALAFLALTVTGINLIISHPRFYWGEAGNVNTPALFQLPIPSSREAVSTGYGYVLPDQNGWSRDLHFEAGWALVLAGLAYWISGFTAGHFRRNLVPARADLRWPSLKRSLASHLRFARPTAEEAHSYNSLQRLAYLAVIFVLFPVMIWTGLAMSPAVIAAFPIFVTSVGGHQSARTIHFFAALLLLAFVLVHVAMVWHAGFSARVRAMITGRTSKEDR